ncbi:hypothetical protein ACD661_11280 [Legionella lytica]|uniref:Uncharacterized protein n=1 Tax=Legionella lytica TaxID=96232 RepID=A0ABW8D8W1_9GAMM
MSRLGQSTAGVIVLVNELINKEIPVVAIKQNLDIKQRVQYPIIEKTMV